MTADDLNRFLAAVFPSGADRLHVEAADGRRAVVRSRFLEDQIRPGGTLSGPTMMALADTAAYVLVLSAIGMQPLAVTSNLNINFLRKPAQADLLAEATMLRLGKTLAVMDVAIRSDGGDALVAHAVVTYALPNGSARA